LTEPKPDSEFESTLSEQPKAQLTHNDELVEHYVFACDATDTAVRIRSLAGSRVRDGAVVAVACRLVYNGVTTLFRAGYEGFPRPEDDESLRRALTADELVHPSDYKSVSDIEKTVRRARPRQDDMILDLDFVDPQIGFEEGNVLLVGRRSLRLRDRASIDELDAISEFFRAQKVTHPAVKMEFVDQGRWPLMP